MATVETPRLNHFKPHSSDYTQLLAIGPKFLASVFRSNPDESQKRNQRFSRNLIKWIKEGDIVYKRLLLNQHALDEAATHLKKNASPNDAFRCVNTALSSDIIEIKSTANDEFESACETFCRYDDHDGAMTDFITRSFVRSSETVYLATWDHHYQAFDGMRLLPRCDYE